MGLAVGYFDLCLNSHRINGVIIPPSRQTIEPTSPSLWIQCSDAILLPERLSLLDIVSSFHLETCQTEACFYPKENTIAIFLLEN